MDKINHVGHRRNAKSNIQLFHSIFFMFNTGLLILELITKNKFLNYRAKNYRKCSWNRGNTHSISVINRVQYSEIHIL